MKKVIFFFLLYNFSIEPNIINEKSSTDSEFIVKKKPLAQSSAKVRESIILNVGKTLKINVTLDKFSLNLRTFLLDEVDKYLEEDQNSFLICANKKELQDALNELVSIKTEVEKNLTELEKKLEKLKYKFKFIKN